MKGCSAGCKLVVDTAEKEPSKVSSQQKMLTADFGSRAGSDTGTETRALQPADRACSLLLLTADFRRLFLGYIDDGKVVAVRSKKRHAEKKCRKEIVYSSRFVRVIKCRKQKRNAETPPKRAAFRKKEKTKKNIKKKL